MASSLPFRLWNNTFTTPNTAYQPYPGSRDELLLDNVSFHLYKVQMPENTPLLHQEVAVLRGRIYGNTETGIMVWTFGVAILPQTVGEGDYVIIPEHPEFQHMKFYRNPRVPLHTYAARDRYNRLFQRGYRLTKRSGEGCFLWTAASKGKWREQGVDSLRIHIPSWTNRIGTLHWFNDAYIGVCQAVGGFLPNDLPLTTEWDDQYELTLEEAEAEKE